MTAKEQKVAAAAFAAKWSRKGYEKGECQVSSCGERRGGDEGVRFFADSLRDGNRLVSLRALLETDGV